MKRKANPVAKTTRPVFTGVFPRKRLFRLLDLHRSRPVVWISGPLCSGKTILASSYIESRTLPCLWYQIDSRDDDIATFFYYLGLAAKNHIPDRKRPPPLFTPEYKAGFSVFTHRFFEDLFCQLPLPFCFVFDNYQEIGDRSLLHEVIREAIRGIPEGISFIIISRMGLPPAFSSLRGNHCIAMLGGDELALTLKEVKEMAGFRVKEKLADAVTREIHQKTRGWTAGVTIMLERARRYKDAAQITNVGMEPCSECFTFEILEKQDAATKDFLLKTAVLPVMSVQMADSITGLTSSGKILADLHHKNCFTEKRFHDDPIYQYHPIFRDFLLSKAIEAFGEDKVSTLRRNAALILYESGRYEEAFALFRDCSGWEGIERLVTGHARVLISQGRGKIVDAWITSLPDDFLNEHPWLLYWLGLSRMPYHPRNACEYLERAFHLFERHRDVAGIYLSWSGIVDSCVFGLDNLNPLDHWISLLNHIRTTFGEAPSDEIETHVAASMFMALVYREPQHPETGAWGMRALNLAQLTENLPIRALTLSNYAFYKIVAGELEAAALAIDFYRSLIQDIGEAPIFILSMKWIEAFHLSVTGAHQDCLKAVSEGLRLSASTGVYLLDYLLMGYGIISSLNTRDFKSAGKFLKKMSAHYEKMRPCARGLYHLLSGCYIFIHGDAQKAARHFDLALRDAEHIGFRAAQSISHLANAHVRYELKEYVDANHHLKKARKIGRLINYRYVEFISLLTDAYFAFDRNSERTGLSALKKAMKKGRTHGYKNTYLIRPDIMEQLCIKALQAGIETDYVQDILRVQKG